MNGLLHFFQYHNAVPVAVSIALLGAGGVFAATNPEAIYSETETVLSIDNTYLVSKELAAYSPRVEITGVTEDEEDYYVAYKFYTIDLKEYAWQDVVRDEVMKVSKAALGPYRDLGAYVTVQLKQMIESESARLSRTQEDERKNVSQKVVATQYGGLIGKFLDETTEVLPGYTPVVVPPPPPLAAAEPDNQNGSSASSSSSPVSSGGSSNRIGLQLLGNNPARISVGTSYIDLGAVLIDPYNTNVGVYAFLDGRETLSPAIDTSTTTSYTIEYRATDPDGAAIVVRRIVLVGNAPDPGGEISAAGNVNFSPPPPPPPPAPTPAPPPSPEPAPKPESVPTSEPTPAPPAETSTTTPEANAPPPESASSTPAASSSTASTTPAE